MPSTTSRLAIPFPLGTDPVNVPSDMENLANRIDGIIGAESSGTLANRPAFGNAGFKYFATDQTNSGGTLGVWYYDTGSSWDPINPATPDAVYNPGGTFTKLQSGLVNFTTTPVAVTFPDAFTALGSLFLQAVTGLYLPDITASSASGFTVDFYVLSGQGAQSTAFWWLATGS